MDENLNCKVWNYYKPSYMLSGVKTEFLSPLTVLSLVPVPIDTDDDPTPSLRLFICKCHGLGQTDPL